MQPSLGLPPLELCFGTSPIQAEKSRPDRNVLGSANAGDKRGGESRADTGNLIKSSACLAGPMPSPDHAVELQNLRFNPMELIAKRRQTGTGNLWNLLVLRIGDDIKQLLNTLTADRRNDAKLSAMSPDCIDHRGLLSNKQVPRAMEHQTALLLRCLGWHKPHVGPADRLAYRLGVSGIVLLSFDVRLHIVGGISRTSCPNARSWRDQ